MILVLTFVLTMLVSVGAVIYATRHPVSRKVIETRLPGPGRGRRHRTFVARG
jgi:hypothetical protein